MTEIHPADLLGCARSLCHLADGGVLDSLDRGMSDPADLVDRSGFDATELRLLLAVATSLGIAERTEDGSYRLSSAWQSMSNQWPLGLAGQVGLWSCLRNNDPGAGTLPALGPAQYRSSAPGMAKLFNRQAAELAHTIERVPMDFVVDLGGGSGVWGHALATQDGQTRRHLVVDLPAVVSQASQTSRIAGDVVHVPLRDASVGTAVLANVLHVLPVLGGVMAIQEMVRICKPGGLLVLVDSFLDQSRNEIAEAVYDVSLWLRGGERVPLAALRESAERAGAKLVMKAALGRMLTAVVFRVGD